MECWNTGSQRMPSNPNMPHRNNITFDVPGNPNYLILSQTLILPHGLVWCSLRICFMNINPQSRERSINSIYFFFIFFTSTSYTNHSYTQPGFSAIWVYQRPTFQSVWIMVFPHLSLWRPLGNIAHVEWRNGTVKAWANIFHPPQQETNSYCRKQRVDSEKWEVGENKRKEGGDERARENERARNVVLWLMKQVISGVEEDGFVSMWFMVLLFTMGTFFRTKFI